MSWTHCVLSSHTDTALGCVGKALSAELEQFCFTYICLRRELKMRGNIYSGSRLMASGLPMDLPFQHCRAHSIFEAKKVSQTMPWYSGLMAEATWGRQGVGPRYTHSMKRLKWGQGASCVVLGLLNCRAVKTLLPPLSSLPNSPLKSSFLCSFRVG